MPQKVRRMPCKIWTHTNPPFCTHSDNSFLRLQFVSVVSDPEGENLTELVCISYRSDLCKNTLAADLSKASGT